MNVSKLYVILLILVVFPVGFASAGGAAETDAPVLELPAQPRQYISPANQDGVQDTLVLPFSSVVVPADDMVIVEYTLTVFDSDGQAVFSVSEQETERLGFFGSLFGGEKPRVEVPDTLTWDGTWNVAEEELPEGVSNGDQVADGDFTYQLTVTDDAGNSARSAPFNLTVDNTAPRIGEFPQPRYAVFSPNGDDIRETLEVGFTGSRELVWAVEVQDQDGTVVFSQEYRNGTPRDRDADFAPPAPFVWDGSTGTAAEPGALAPEGRYTLVLSGVDRAGNETRAEHPSTFTLSLDVTDLTVRPADPPAMFSPNGDGRRDTLDLAFASSQPDLITEWRIEILNAGQVVRSDAGLGELPDSWTFDGLREDGTILPDGTVTAELAVRLANGTEVVSEPLSITIDTQAPEAVVSATTAPQATDPGDPLVFGAGEKQSLEGTVLLERNEPWEYRLSYNGSQLASGKVANLLDALDLVPRRDGDRDRIEVVWNGQAVLEDGPAADGTYELVLSAEDAAGNRGQSRIVRVIKDGRTPEVGLSVLGETLSPFSRGSNGTITFQTEYQAPELVEEFLFEIRNADDTMVRSNYQRRGFDSFEWNGLTNGGTVVDDGPYTGRLEVIYRNGHVAQVSEVGPVLVDTSGPVGPGVLRLSLRPQPFSPDGDGREDTLNIGIRVDGDVAIDSWSARIDDPTGGVFKRFSGNGEPPQTLTWDGLSDQGELVETAREYPLTVTVIDENGIEVSEEETIAIDILVIRDGDRLRIRVSNILFAPNTPDLFLSNEEQLDTNLDTLRRLATILNRYPERDIIIEGHAAHVFLRDPAMQREQEQVLIPLSRSRAREVMQALMILGVDRERMSIEGIGGARPVVPHSDRENMGQNRRVEFLLERNGR
jgi:outer membrane protein OmpA-like peptidoglycan-associated protein/flagellar hook assembly protein FlgD